jgi:hypothetical protein
MDLMHFKKKKNVNNLKKYQKCEENVELFTLAYILHRPLLRYNTETTHLNKILASFLPLSLRDI